MGFIYNVLEKRRKKKYSGEEYLQKEIKHQEQQLVVAKAREKTSDVIGGIIKSTTPKQRKGIRRVRRSPMGASLFAGNAAALTGELPPMRQPSRQSAARQPQRDVIQDDFLNIQGGILAPLDFSNGSNNSKGKKKKSKNNGLDIISISNNGFDF